MSADDDRERIYQALQKILEGFFEGHNVQGDERLEYLRRLSRFWLARSPMPAPSRVKIGSEADITRMWAAHEKKRKAKKPKVRK
ncbi:hypothetical protein GCM10007874_50280 [Labrys miyagiensis]|uniref:Uncharacterized protein n=1 Tax=Labrys miyagiensis TaxID=346912 RepID=A0ABQ6CUT8_9HYPH|nr:hypothetical protein [Labrys miyagiensis]GLS22011.1 hypothetical protein GCM10007874_50280 [Labrys miyagiensis]